MAAAVAHHVGRDGGATAADSHADRARFGLFRPDHLLDRRHGRRQYLDQIVIRLELCNPRLDVRQNGSPVLNGFLGRKLVGILVKGLFVTWEHDVGEDIDFHGRTSSYLSRLDPDTRDKVNLSRETKKFVSCGVWTVMNCYGG